MSEIESNCDGLPGMTRSVGIVCEDQVEYVRGVRHIPAGTLAKDQIERRFARLTSRFQRSSFRTAAVRSAFGQTVISEA